MNPETDVDILIRGGTLLTMSEAMEIVHDPVIGIRDGRILFIARPGEPAFPVRAGETIDASHSIVMPGLINCHTHAAMTCFRGIADDLSLMDWLNNYIFPAEAKHVNREMVHAGSLLAIAEMILSGTTTFSDGYFYESSVARAALEAGMRAVTAQGFIDSPGAGKDALPGNVRIAEKFIEKWLRKSPLVIPALFCHSPYACSPETLRSIKEVARQAKVPYIIHLSETRDEVKIIRERHGVSPVMHLEKTGVLDEATIAVHCVWPDDREIDLLAERGVKVSHNPESNMKLASGVAPVPDMLRRGVTVGLGTDAPATTTWTCSRRWARRPDSTRSGGWIPPSWTPRQSSKWPPGKARESSAWPIRSDRSSPANAPTSSSSTRGNPTSPPFTTAIRSSSTPRAEPTCRRSSSTEKSS